MKKCPVCKLMTMHDEDVRNSLSRKDNETYICNECGTQEAFDDTEDRIDREAKQAVIKWLKEYRLTDTDDFD